MFVVPSHPIHRHANPREAIPHTRHRSDNIEPSLLTSGSNDHRNSVPTDGWRASTANLRSANVHLTARAGIKLAVIDLGSVKIDASTDCPHIGSCPKRAIDILWEERANWTTPEFNEAAVTPQVTACAPGLSFAKAGPASGPATIRPPCSHSLERLLQDGGCPQLSCYEQTSTDSIEDQS
jgi:hypothetical protein